MSEKVSVAVKIPAVIIFLSISATPLNNAHLGGLFLWIIIPFSISIYFAGKLAHFVRQVGSNYHKSLQFKEGKKMAKLLEILDQLDPEQLMQDAKDSIDSEFYTAEQLKDKIMIEAKSDDSLLDDKWCLIGNFIHHLKENVELYVGWSYVLVG